MDFLLCYYHYFNSHGVATITHCNRGLKLKQTRRSRYWKYTIIEYRKIINTRVSCLALPIAKCCVHYFVLFCYTSA